MARLIKVAVALAIVGLVLGYGLYGGKPKPPVQVRVSFEGLTDLNFLPNDPHYYVHKFHNDALGPYVAANGMTAQITGDAGDLIFEIGHHSARSALVIFPFVKSQLGDYLPDTAGVYPPPAEDVPVDYFIMRTYNSSSYNDPRLNFLTMTPNTPKQVRLWAWLCTETLHSYRVIHNQPDPDHPAGIVQVIAYDTNGDNILDCWEITPVPGTGDLAWIIRWSRADDYLYYGSHPMPFKLIVERL